ncbi:MAG: phosphoribosylformimino-5-aminoimidazole carboxamide ribotide isomerase [Myxococcales bacterium]|nr:phosphoribosylformimino-5-aminoimidazole carboxamide ribotide isomerase [Myxococcales bacterium]
MTLFRPCIDLHAGKVKQIVGGTLSDQGRGPRENFVSEHGPAHFAGMYREDGLVGGHVIKLGPGNDAAAREALGAWPAGLQLGGGIDAGNAAEWLAAGASKVIVTSWLFENGRLSQQRLDALGEVAGPEQLVIDLSCRRRDDGWRVAVDRWQTITEVPIEARTFERLAAHCSEFLIHAADVEGLCRGIDAELVQVLGEQCPLPCTYAGGANRLSDLERVAELSAGRVDLTFGSALDIFGGELVRYADCVAHNRAAG